ncbi:hypothetical protein WHR41_07232 [Cladosporium halotolerans]|uniref:Nitrogen regulatory protein areA GATA-like domain-containing protein n=1 Tax=Cladosporium halotolerans TaxID=1052096 RepID=A0AB34KME3_9PEZI
MPFRPEHSLLRVEVPALHTIDTRSVENLFGMWSLFSKTSHAMEDGKRLENLSWRLWNRETFCCAQPDEDARPRLSPPSAFAAKPHAATADIPVPDLSSSLESAVSDELDESSQARPELTRHLSSESRSRACEKHITPVDLEKIVISIKESQKLSRVEFAMPASSFKPEPVVVPSTSVSQDFSKLTFDEPNPSASTEIAPAPSASRSTLPISSTSTVNTHDSDISHDRADSQESSSTEMSTHSIIRGFKPGGAPSSYRSQTNLASQPTPILKTSPKYQPSQPKKKGAMFTIGTSSGEDESSLDSHMYKSSLSESLKNGDCKKQTSFKDEVAIGRAASRHSPVFESDDEDEEISESAIEDDDDSSDWEDSEDNSGPSSVNDREPLFQRVDSQANLTSRRSMLTTLMHEPDRARAMANEASRSTPALRRSRTTTPNGPSVAGSPVPSVQLHAPIQEPTRSKPIIMTTSNTIPQQLALSPRTTRRNMLSTELTESLRKNLLWERQHRSTGNLTALKRRHTSTDVKNLKQQPEPAPIFSHPDGAKKFNSEYHNAGLQEYNAKGW